MADWSGICENSDFGVPNSDIGLGFVGCVGERTLTSVTIDSIDPEITCPEDITEIVNVGELFTIPDYTVSATVTDFHDLDFTIYGAWKCQYVYNCFG